MCIRDRSTQSTGVTAPIMVGYGHPRFGHHLAIPHHPPYPMPPPAIHPPPATPQPCLMDYDNRLHYRNLAGTPSSIGAMRTAGTMKASKAGYWQVIYHPGVAFRNSPNWDDKISGLGAPAGVEVYGVEVAGDDGRAFVHTPEDRFLPVRTQNSGSVGGGHMLVKLADASNERVPVPEVRRPDCFGSVPKEPRAVKVHKGTSDGIKRVEYELLQIEPWREFLAEKEESAPEEHKNKSELTDLMYERYRHGSPVVNWVEGLDQQLSGLNYEH
eukprot:TRINITY_DN8599_c0_g1_i3.p2 TRINITY_DN8599_c0_g1~~TRINITY_DN8599_c0_g1_i3.p2  ORF type:complete len:270 (-),score=51.11 TRINITY_DN8599_c0_g1_i3:192-1001(-)